jgi:hypothetical protein
VWCVSKWHSWLRNFFVRVCRNFTRQALLIYVLEKRSPGGTQPPSAITKGCARYRPRGATTVDRGVVGVSRGRVRCGCRPPKVFARVAISVTCCYLDSKMSKVENRRMHPESRKESGELIGSDVIEHICNKVYESSLPTESTHVAKKSRL